MGIFAVDIEIARIVENPAYVPVAGVMVDTGAEFSWISESRLRQAGIQPWKKDQPFIMANGQEITRQMGYAILRCGEFKTVDEVVFALEGDLELLGARTIEGFNATVDPRSKRLVAAGPSPAARSVRHR